VGELARMAQTVLLALDADSAGQEAMLKAFRLANKRKLDLRVVMLPVGSDPADLIQREGAEAMASIVAKSISFVMFRAERVLASGDPSNSEDQDRMIDELRPVFAELPPSALRMELTQMVESRMALPGGAAERLLSQPQRATTRSSEREDANSRGVAAAPRQVRVSQMTRREDTERAFLALCIASPAEGAEALASLELDEHFSSGLLRRAAKHLREGDLGEPMADAPGEDPPLEEDPQLKGLLAELVVEAGRDESDTAMLEVQRLQLELARVDRQIQRARGQEAGDVSGLAHRRAEVKLQFDRAYGRVLEQTGGG
jgi:DNA primase